MIVYRSYVSDKFKKILWSYIKPTDPAVNPTARKNANSSNSLGRELTIRLI